MEFDQNTPDQRPDISDAVRLAASAKHITLTPLHEDVLAPEMSEEYEANQHTLEGPIANVSIDTESTVGYPPRQANAQESVATPPQDAVHPGAHRRARTISFAVAILLVCAVSYLMLFRQ